MTKIQCIVKQTDLIHYFMIIFVYLCKLKVFCKGTNLKTSFFQIRHGANVDFGTKPHDKPHPRRAKCYIWLTPDDYNHELIQKLHILNNVFATTIKVSFNIFAKELKKRQ